MKVLEGASARPAVGSRKPSGQLGEPTLPDETTDAPNRSYGPEPDDRRAVLVKRTAAAMGKQRLVVRSPLASDALHARHLFKQRDRLIGVARAKIGTQRQGQIRLLGEVIATHHHPQSRIG